LGIFDEEKKKQISQMNTQNDFMKIPFQTFPFLNGHGKSELRAML
jgi:hypothetical protein